jgi:hypothetical protein
MSAFSVLLAVLGCQSVHKVMASSWCGGEDLLTACLIRREGGTSRKKAHPFKLPTPPWA